MSDRPYVPFYKPYGMTDEEYEHEVRIAKQKLAEWEAEQQELENPFHVPISEEKAKETLDDLPF